MIQVYSTASEESSHILEGAFLSINLVVRGVVLVSSSGHDKLALRDYFIGISRLK